MESEGVPRFGIKRKLDHEYPENWSQDKRPSLRIILDMLPLILRYLVYYVKLWWRGKEIIMDFLHPLQGKQIYGVPLGGLGCGSIGRGFKGEFCRFQIVPGVYEYNTVEADQFILTIKDEDNVTLFQTLLSTYKRNGKHLRSWQSLLDGSKCEYTGLYPRSWTQYDLSEYGLKLTLRQVSPVIPNNYKDSSLPTAAFIWDIENVSKKTLNVTIAFTFKNGTGNEKLDKKATCSSKSFSYQDSEGVILYNTIDHLLCAYAVSTAAKEGAVVSKCLNFDPCSDGKREWDQLYERGRFDKTDDKKKQRNHVFGDMGCAVASQIKLDPSQKDRLVFNLVWDVPTVSFAGKKRKYNKYYTKFFGVENAALKLVDYANKNFGAWEAEIYGWQKGVLDDPNLPSWYKGALFNETYYVSDGGSLWFIPEESDLKHAVVDDPRLKYGRFAYLEGHEYRMYNTYDVNFYASFALAMNWPLLQLCVQYDFKDSIFTEIPEKVTALYSGKSMERKVKFTVPHDLGDPAEEPFLLINAYNIHDVSEWRDLNTKFVLQVFRDLSLFDKNEEIDSIKYLQDMYKACHVIMSRTKMFDADVDGLIENSGSPDQTYDTWIMTGPSAYCGGLWLAALFAMVTMSERLHKAAEGQSYRNLLDKAKKSFDAKLWNGQFYKFDVTKPDTIMADQLCGHWYLRASGVKHEVFERDRVRSCLETIYKNNVRSFRNGTLGAVNGFLANAGSVDHITLQSEEVWVGVNYGLAATMIHEGMLKEAWSTIEGLSTFLTEELGMCFETPEAVYCEKYYRAIGYMRPLSIWAMQLAVQQHHT